MIGLDFVLMTEKILRLVAKVCRNVPLYELNHVEPLLLIFNE